MKGKHKPIRKCHGCGLNLGDHCATYEFPREMWHHRSCPGYKNEEKLREYETELARHPPNQKKQMRREVAKRRASEPHHQGTLHYANR